VLAVPDRSNGRGSGRGSGRGGGHGRGRGSDTPRSDGITEPGLPDKVTWDILDPDALRDLGSRRAASFVTYSISSAGGPTSTLRTRCAEDLYRLQCFDQPHGQYGKAMVLYTEDRLSTAAGVKGRLVAGFKVGELPDDFPSVDILRDLASAVGDYAATRSSFNAPKLYKQYVRAPGADIDRSKSFPSAVFARYPDLDAVGKWSSDPEAVRVLIGCEMKALKDFLNSAAGCGQPVIQGFLDNIGATSLPAFLRTYLDQLKEAARRDLQSDEGKAIAVQLVEHPALFGGKEISQYALANKVHFIRNCIFERVSMDVVDPGLAEVAVLASDESDGKYVVPFVGHAPVASWIGAVREACSGDSGRWEWKPYDTKDAIIEKLKADNPRVPAHLWDLRDD
jgi:hypothetical protein